MRFFDDCTFFCWLFLIVSGVVSAVGGVLLKYWPKIDSAVAVACFSVLITLGVIGAVVAVIMLVRISDERCRVQLVRGNRPGVGGGEV